MVELISALFEWMPPLLALICYGAVTLFFLVAALRLVAFVLDIIPFL